MIATACTLLPLLVPIALGLLPAALLLRRDHLLVLIGEAFAVGSIIIAIVSAIPPVIPLDFWFYVIDVLAILSAIGFAVFARTKHAAFSIRQYRLVFVAAAAAIAVSGLRLLTEADIGWDAVNYYFLTAVDFSVHNRVDVFYSHAVTLADKAPVPLYPLVLVLYSMSIDIASLLHSFATTAVRLIPLGFFIGVLAAMFRISRRCLPGKTAYLLPILILSMPLMIDYWQEYSHYVDLPVTMFASLALAEVLDLQAESGNSRRRWLALGLWISGLLLTKVTGLAIAAMVLYPVAIGFIRPKLYARLVAVFGTILLALGGIAIAGMPLLGEGWRWLTFILCSAGLIALAPLLCNTLPPAALRAAWPFVVGCIPGIAFVIRHSAAMGSMIGYYSSSLIHTSPQMAWALKLLGRHSADKSLSLPGTPEHDPLMPWFGWPLPPAVAWVTTALPLSRPRNAQALAALGSFVLLYFLAWDSVFNFVDVRELLPISPIVATLFVASVLRLTRNAALTAAATFLLLLLSLPFAVIPQQGQSDLFDGILVFFQLHGWTAASTSSLVTGIAITAGSIVITIATLWPLRGRLSRVSSVPLVIASLTILLLLQMPFLMTLRDFRRDANSKATNAYHEGYFQVLHPLLLQPGKSVVLTYVGYGYEWYSVGRLRRIELISAADVASLRPYLGDARSLRQHLRELGVDYAVMPEPGTPYYLQYHGLITDPQMHALAQILNGSPSVVKGQWRIYSLNSRKSIAFASSRVSPIKRVMRSQRSS